MSPNGHRENRGGMNRGNRQGGHQNTHLSPIPSPYNFVPLSDFVYFPDWANQVSHDVPFSDGISGCLEIEVVAKTPIYIRNGGNFSEEDKKNRNSACQDFFSTVNGFYAVPATSFKGMIRNIVEIISFSKIRVDDNRYSIRDLYFPDYTQQITETVRDRVYRSKAKSGWLELRGESWVLIPCEYARVEQEDLENYRNNQVSIGLNRESSKQKYSIWGTNLDIRCDIDSRETSYTHSRGLRLFYRKARNLGNGNATGTLVFTGQPMPRGENGRKHMEFIFFNRSGREISVDCLRKDFEFIHSDPKDRNKENEEWGYWKRKLSRGESVPVFYLERNGQIDSMGLAMMYRLPYAHSIQEAVGHTSPSHLENKRHDLAELMFGYVNEKTQESLRGRVQVGHLKMVKSDGVDIRTLTQSIVTTVLGSPKPTYYPNYVCQSTDNQGNVAGNYKTFMDPSCEIRGWKRYSVRKDGDTPTPQRPPVVNGRENLDVATTFKPLKAGATFRGKIRVHNLRPEEIGALVWALTWGGNHSLRHVVGMAKPYGYGSIAVKIIDYDLKDAAQTPVKIDKINESFERAMEKEKPGWKSSDQIRELLSMANPDSNPPMDDTKYPFLGRGRDNEFVQYKKDRKALLSFSGKLVSPISPVQGHSSNTQVLRPTKN